MSPTLPTRTFKASPLEVFLGIGVVLGLVYMVYLFGFHEAGPSRNTDVRLGVASQHALTEIIHHQGEIDQLVGRLEERLTTLAGSGADLGELKAELRLLRQSIDMIEARLGEMSRLLPLPAPSPVTPQDSD